jgi:diacylglycerol kinase family enzyme
MYYYIIDQGNLPVDKFERLQTETLGYLAEFKISGEAGRVTPLRSISDLVETASQRGAKTLVACGSDSTFNLMVAALKGRDFTLGYIPYEENSYLATILGLDSIFTGAKTIAARRIERVDMAKLSGNYFLGFLEFGVMSQNIKTTGLMSGFKLLSSEPVAIKIRIDDSYTISIPALGGLAVNARLTPTTQSKIADPTDGFLDLLILEPLNKLQILRYKKDLADGRLENVPKTSVVKCRKISFLEPRNLPLTMLGRVVTKIPAEIEIIPQRLRLIVGKNRTF